MLLPTVLDIWFCLWQMLLPLVFATCILFGWCCCHVALLYDRWWCNYHQTDVVACLFVLADVIAVCFCDCWYCHIFWFELCQRCTTVVAVASLLADVIAKMTDGIAIVCIWQMLLQQCITVHAGRCYCLMADGMPTMGVDGWCYCQCGRWNGHWVNVLILILLFCAGPHPIYEANGTCLCFCLGKGHWPLWIELLSLL